MVNCIPTALFRIFDANINRVKEGLRVCEEIMRFLLNSKSLTAECKDFRHSIDRLVKILGQSEQFIKGRNASKDIGLKVKHRDEFSRKNIFDIFYANIQRVKESLRVLEECSKLSSPKIALKFRNLRYRVYDFEKKALVELNSLKCSKGVRN
ncbi:MAG: thiamine-phosphate pyrophosphorylase [Candidatus Omnitrophica bacterium]|nr:thiamine-phosphate pyrophosphorylase [Candidatus Omnitrophota bacterium]